MINFGALAPGINTEPITRSTEVMDIRKPAYDNIHDISLVIILNVFPNVKPIENQTFALMKPYQQQTYP
jgi:hypothetical protein